MSKDRKNNIRDLSPAELGRWMAERKYERFRVDQVLDWLYKKEVSAAEPMTNLPPALRRELEQSFSFRTLEPAETLVSSDSTRKFLFILEDGAGIESVWIPEPDRRRATLCLSTQVGCRMACAFCRTGQTGFRRNLTPSEIVGQLLAVRRHAGRVTNLVFMGMGEPLDNLENLEPALALLLDPRAFGFSPRRLTISTIGLTPGILRLAEKEPGVRLALSLHSARPEVRKKILPAKPAADLEAIKAALKKHQERSRLPLTLELVMMKGVNDSLKEARAVVGFASGLRAKVNLIPLNPYPGCAFEPAEETAVLKFQAFLKDKGLPAFIRKSRGADIMAACGQLAGR